MQKKSIYSYAAAAGLPAGLYLTLMSASLLLSVRIPSIVMFLIPLAIGFPFMLWFLMRNISKAEPTYNKFSSLWLGGIYTVIFGTLICLLLSGLYVVFIEPGFVHMYVMNAIEAIESTSVAPEYEQTLALMREAIEARILPTGLEFLLSMAWLTCFSGSVISLFIAMLIPRDGKKMSREISA